MGCGRSKFHSQNESETNGKAKTIEPDSGPATSRSEFENSKVRMRRCTPAITTNGALQQGEFNITAQDKTVDKFSSQPFGNRGVNSTQILRVTNSQLEFFKMLDEKIEQGSCSSDEEETAVVSFKETQYKTEIENS